MFEQHRPEKPTLSHWRGTVQYLEFEHHKVGKWKEYGLSDIIEFLANLQFNCFWVHNNGGLFKITHCYFQKQLDKKKMWSNVASN